MDVTWTEKRTVSPPRWFPHLFAVTWNSSHEFHDNHRQLWTWLSKFKKLSPQKRQLLVTLIWLSTSQPSGMRIPSPLEKWRHNSDLVKITHTRAGEKTEMSSTKRIRVVASVCCDCKRLLLSFWSLFHFFHVLLLQLENLLKMNKVPFGNLY